MSWCGSNHGWRYGKRNQETRKPEDLDEWLVIAAGFIMFFCLTSRMFFIAFVFLLYPQLAETCHATALMTKVSWQSRCSGYTCICINYIYKYIIYYLAICYTMSYIIIQYTYIIIYIYMYYTYTLSYMCV